MNAYTQDFESAAPQETVAKADVAEAGIAHPRHATSGSSVKELLTTKTMLRQILGNAAFLVGALLIVSTAALIGTSYPQAASTANVIVVAGAAFGLSFGIYSTWRVLQSSVIPMYQIGNTMLRISEQKRNTVVPFLDRNDEIGTLARALNQFSNWGFERDDMIEERKRMEEERVEMAGRRTRSLNKIADEFETTMGNVSGSVAASASQLHAAATSMEAAAAGSITQTEEVARAMQQNTEGVTSVAATSDEFALSISEISRQVALSAELARDAGSTATSANDTISSLSASADQIGTIVELISSIAKRTNLLALNASIESARGGEAGRGFAVVAAEVKELAAQTGRATDEVAKQIRAIQDSTGDSVSALQAIGTKISQLEETAVSIASAVDQQSVAGQELARNIDMAARSTSEISDKLAKLREAATTSGAAATQTLGSANELERQASTLTTQGEVFLTKMRQV